MLKKILAVLLMASVSLTCLAKDRLLEAAGIAEELDWSALIPAGYDPNAVYDEYQEKYDIESLDEDDPYLKELMDKLAAIHKSSPVQPTLSGKLVKLPGYIVPLETDGKKSTEFLLVPYFGACIHVPPPPLNQTVYVKTEDEDGAELRKLFDIVWVTGIITVETQSTELAEAGYTIAALKVEPYE